MAHQDKCRVLDGHATHVCTRLAGDGEYTRISRREAVHDHRSRIVSPVGSPEHDTSASGFPARRQRRD
eukprot:409087-Rhodomonas_salina.1